MARSSSIRSNKFEHALEAEKQRTGATTDAELHPESLERVVSEFKEIVRQVRPALSFPTEPRYQLKGAVWAVFANHGTATAPRPIAPTKHSGRPRHRRQRPVDGLRQHGPTPAPASCSRATPRRVRTACTGIICRMRRARTWWPASHDVADRPSSATCRMSIASSKKSPTA